MDLSGWSSAWIIGLFVLGIVALLGGGHALVVGSSGLARRLDVHPIIVGLTVVALGTSMPELATSVIAALKGESDLSIGNILGSNIFNLMAVTGPTALANPLPVSWLISPFLSRGRANSALVHTHTG